jgi:F-type H+-transporting ATPase subunit epsilon
MAIPNELQLVVVTPEKTLVDEPVLAVRLPLYDGQIGILPGRAPLVGRLGYGALVARTAAGETTHYVDGGFVQVKNNVVSVLTNRALSPGQIDRQEAASLLQSAFARVATSDHETATRFRDQERARRMLSISG